MIEVITQILPLLMSTFGSAFAVFQKNKQEDHARQLELMAVQNDHQVKFINAQTKLVKNDKYFAWTRRFLALGFTIGFFAVLWVLPSISMETSYIFEVPGTSWLFGLYTSGPDFQVIQGLPVTAVNTLNYAVQAIIGLYFGQSMMKR